MINNIKQIDIEFCAPQEENMPFSQVDDGAFTKTDHIPTCPKQETF